MKKYINRKSMPLIVLAVLLLAFAGIMTVSASPEYVSEDHVTQLELNHIQIALLELFH